MERERLENLVDEVNIDRKHWRTDLVTEILSELAKEKTASGELVEELRDYLNNDCPPIAWYSLTEQEREYFKGVEVVQKRLGEILSRYSARKEVVLAKINNKCSPKEIFVARIKGEVVHVVIPRKMSKHIAGTIIFVEEDSK